MITRHALETAVQPTLRWGRAELQTSLVTNPTKAVSNSDSDSSREVIKSKNPTHPSWSPHPTDPPPTPTPNQPCIIMTNKNNNASLAYMHSLEFDGTHIHVYKITEAGGDGNLNLAPAICILLYDKLVLYCNRAPLLLFLKISNPRVYSRTDIAWKEVP